VTKAAIFLANANDCGDGMAAGRAEASPEASAGGTTFVTSSSPAAFGVTCGGGGSRYDDEVSSLVYILYWGRVKCRRLPLVDNSPWQSKYNVLPFNMSLICPWECRITCSSCEYDACCGMKAAYGDGGQGTSFDVGSGHQQIYKKLLAFLGFSGCRQS
jgi:hypothetical protein